jgi:hypothetical protein
MDVPSLRELVERVQERDRGTLLGVEGDQCQRLG